MTRAAALLLLVAVAAAALPPGPSGASVEIEVDRATVSLPNTPARLRLDFTRLLRERGIDGRFDPRSVVVEAREPATGRWAPVDARLSEHFKYGTAGDLMWLVPTPGTLRFRVRFDAERRPPRPAPEYVPAIGLGDELPCNAGAPQPLFQQAGVLFADLDGDGIRDALVNTNYTNTLDWPEDGIFVHRGEPGAPATVADARRVHTLAPGSDDPRILHARYNWAHPVDWDGDGRIDLLYVSFRRRDPPAGTPAIERGESFVFLRNEGRRDPGGMPIFVETRHYGADAVTRDAYVPAVSAADLDGDGRVDLVGLRTSGDNTRPRLASALFYRNRGPDARGIPLLDEPVTLKTRDGEVAGFHAVSFHVSLGDVDGDGRIDLIGTDDYLESRPTLWYRNLGGRPPLFAPRQELAGLPPGGHRWAAWNGGEGLLHLDTGELRRRRVRDGRPEFTAAGRLLATDNPLLFGLQEKPYWVDWDDDGDFDLVSGEALGTIRLYRNGGTRTHPRFAAPVRIEAGGAPIRIYRDGVMGGRHWHGPMGYPSVACVDWDHDGLFDLVIPNETDRVFWYRNVGRRGEPRFGPRGQVLPDGFTETPEKLERARAAAANPTLPNHPYPYLDDEPFFWRTRIAIADYTGDGLLDMIAKNGAGRVVLYARYRAPDGTLRLRPGVPVLYEDGAPLDRASAPFYKLAHVDWDRDGRIDLVAMQGWGKPSELWLRNVGTPQAPRFARGVPFEFDGRPIVHSNHGLQPSFVDWDGDGALDFVGCNESGHYLFFRHAALLGALPRVHLREHE
jgi:hypothetical protein